MREQKVDQIFGGLLFLAQLLWHAGGVIRCDKGGYMINVMLMNDSMLPVSAGEIEPAVEWGMELVKDDLKGKSISLSFEGQMSGPESIQKNASTGCLPFCLALLLTYYPSFTT